MYKSMRGKGDWVGPRGTMRWFIRIHPLVQDQRIDGFYGCFWMDSEADFPQELLGFTDGFLRGHLAQCLFVDVGECPVDLL